MAIVKRIGKSGATYQVRIKGSDGLWITASFPKKFEAEAHEAKLKALKSTGHKLSNVANQISFDDYFFEWDRETRGNNVSEGWRNDQVRYFKKYVSPLVGSLKLQAVGPRQLNNVLTRMGESGLSQQMKLHVFNLLHKVFRDAIELFEILNRNPMKKVDKPALELREAAYLPLEQVRSLLGHLQGSRIETAVMLQFFAGLRVGEVQALEWNNVDFDRGRILIAGTFVRKENRMKDSPKNKKQHGVPIPDELREHLALKKASAKSNFVASETPGEKLCYNGYYKALKSACKRLGITEIGTHGLRHSASELYLENGASVYDVKRLFAHSDMKVTERYMHDRGERLEKVANVIRLIPRTLPDSSVSQKFPKENSELISSQNTPSAVGSNP